MWILGLKGLRNPGLSQILSNGFLCTNMKLEFTKILLSTNNTKCNSKQYIGR